MCAALKDFPPFATMLLLPPLACRENLGKGKSEVMMSYVSCWKASAMPNTPHIRQFTCRSDNKSLWKSTLSTVKSYSMYSTDFCKPNSAWSHEMLHTGAAWEAVSANLHLWYHWTLTELFFAFFQITLISKILSAGSLLGESHHSSSEPLLKQFTPSETLKQKKPSQWDIS